jgi:ABC-type multidrug transport system ATPase subunit
MIALENISFSSQSIDIIRNVSGTFRQGETTALVGPSGGGKSTVLKLAAGLLIPTEGKVYFRGQDIALMNRAQNMAFRRESAVVFQDSALWANQNLYQILELPLKLHFPDMSKGDRDKRIKEVTNEVGYKRDLMIRPSSLSMGEQKLIACARALLCWPVLYFLDELTESLDDVSDQRLINLLKRFKQEHKTLIFVSHDFRMIHELADHIVVIAGGCLLRTIAATEIASDDDLARHIGE